jgi:hypothetical protein
MKVVMANKKWLDNQISLSINYCIDILIIYTRLWQKLITHNVTNLGSFAKDLNFDIFFNMPFFTLQIHLV